MKGSPAAIWLLFALPLIAVIVTAGYATSAQNAPNNNVATAASPLWHTTM
jgi:hypothetical protein